MRTPTLALALTLALVLGAPALAQAPAPKPAPKPAAPPAPAPAPGAGREALVHAYQKEYTFLVDEEAALQARLAEVEADHTRRVGAATAELTALEERLRLIERELEAGRARLAQVEEKGASGDDAGDALAAILAQAGGVVPSLAALAPSADAKVEDTVRGADRALEAVLGSLRERGGFTKVAGSFFLPSGAETRGDVVWVGSVACLGASPQAAGPLVPAGSGALQLWSPAIEGPDAAAARAAAGGRLPDLLPLYVFESIEKPIDQPVTQSLAQYISRGGDVAWVIVTLGVATCLFVLLRVVILTRGAGDPDPLLEKVVPLLAAGERDRALVVAKGWGGAAARVVEAMLPQLGHGQERLESVASERTLAQLQRLERFETAILVAASVSPLLGLLGTVTGMISTFDVITLFGSGDPRLLAGGISEALVATAMGLYVAIPALLLGNVLSTWTESLRAGMERAALRLLLVEAEHEEREQARAEEERRASLEARNDENGNGNGNGNGHGNGNGDGEEDDGRESGIQDLLAEAAGAAP